jgi:hypothetical protein
MALFKGSLGVISGKIGAAVFASNRGGQIVRVWRKPTNHQTVRQMQARANMASASQGYKALTNAQRTAWTNWAASHSVINRLGAAIILSGISAYNALASRTLDRGGTPATIPPSTPSPATPTTCSAVVGAAAGTAVITFTPTPIGATKRLVLWACAPGPPSQDPSRKQAKLISYAATNTPTGAVFTLPGAMNQNDVINLWVSVLDDFGRMSPSLKLRCVVAA